MKLYEFAPMRSIRVRWALQELGLDFESVTVDVFGGALRDPSFLAINPAGKIPVLIDGDVILTESVAIVFYLAEKYPERGLMPLDTAGRAEALRWMLFVQTELEQPLWRIARHTNLYPEGDRLPQEVDRARRDFGAMCPVLEDRLRGRAFVLGDCFTIADIVASHTLDWANEVKLLEPFPEARDYFERHLARPAAPPRIREALASVLPASRPASRSARLADRS